MPEARDIRAQRLVRSDPGELFEFLSDLENHWLLADRFIDVLELDGDRPARGGRVRMRGPLGMRRTAVTRVLEVLPETRIAGTAEIGARTLAHVSWTLFGVDGGTRVELPHGSRGPRCSTGCCSPPALDHGCAGVWRGSSRASTVTCDATRGLPPRPVS